MAFNLQLQFRMLIFRPIRLKVGVVQVVFHLGIVSCTNGKMNQHVTCPSHMFALFIRAAWYFAKDESLTENFCIKWGGHPPVCESQKNWVLQS